MEKTVLGKKIEELRESKGWTQKDFAKKLRVSLLTIQNWETGISAPNTTRFHQIADVLKVSLTDLGLADNLNPNKIGDRLKFARLYRGMSIENFANEFGFTIQNVKSWESHRKEINELSMERISRALKVPVDYFSIRTERPFQMVQEAE